MQMLCTPPVQDVLLPEDNLAMLIAALCHDLGHDGLSNSYRGVCVVCVCRVCVSCGVCVVCVCVCMCMCVLFAAELQVGTGRP